MGGILTPMARAPLTRADIVRRARTMVQEQGSGRVSFRSVARAMGVTAPALYAHVEDFDELLAAVAADEFQRLTDAFAAVDDDDPIDRMRALGHAYVQHALAEPNLHRLMFRYPPAVPDAKVPVPTFEPATELFRVAMQPVQDALAAGRLKPVDPFLAALSLWSAAHGVAEVLLMGFAFPDEMANDLVDAAIDAAIAHWLA